MIHHGLYQMVFVDNHFFLRNFPVWSLIGAPTNHMTGIITRRVHRQSTSGSSKDLPAKHKVNLTLFSGNTHRVPHMGIISTVDRVSARSQTEVSKGTMSCITQDIGILTLIASTPYQYQIGFRETFRGGSHHPPLQD